MNYYTKAKTPIKGWISPEGDIIEVPFDHSIEAQSILEDKHGYPTREYNFDPNSNLMKNGYIRYDAKMSKEVLYFELYNLDESKFKLMKDIIKSFTKIIIELYDISSGSSLYSYSNILERYGIGAFKNELV